MQLVTENTPQPPIEGFPANSLFIGGAVKFIAQTPKNARLPVKLQRDLPIDDRLLQGEAVPMGSDFSLKIEQDYGPIGFKPTGFVFLVGPLKIFNAQGVDCTPGGNVRKALLALLLLSARKTKSRAALQSMFWGTREQSQAAGSLRTALSVLKRELAPLDQPVIESDMQAIRLLSDGLWIDTVALEKGGTGQLDKLAETDLLEGLDLTGDAVEDFEDWLRTERAHWNATFDTLQAAQKPAIATRPIARTKDRGERGIGLLNCITPQAAGNAGILGDIVLDAIAEDLRMCSGAEVYDYRDSGAAHFDGTNGVGPDFLLQIQAGETGNGVALSLKVKRTSDEHQLWSQNVFCPANEGFDLKNSALGAFTARAVEQLSTSLEDLPGKRTISGNTPYQALNMMFSLDDVSMQRVQAMLELAHEETGETVHLSLLSYLSTLQTGESWQRNINKTGAEIRTSIGQVLKNDGFNGLSLSAAGYALYYLSDQEDIAGDLMARAVELSPTQAFCWDHLALYHFHSGRLEAARIASERALLLGAFSPLRYAYETTRCMIASAQQDHQTAVHFGQRALSRKPVFSAALRYTVANLGHLGQVDQAQKLARRIFVLDPDFGVEKVKQGLFRLGDDNVRNTLALGLQKAGLN